MDSHQHPESANGGRLTGHRKAPRINVDP